MARPKSFDPAEVLQGAAELFQAKGYEAASIQDLVDHLGVNRQSLYNEFGDKASLYQAALQTYRNDSLGPIASCLSHTKPIRKAFRDLFTFGMERALSPKVEPCFIAKAALDTNAHDPVIQQCIRGQFEDVLALMENRLKLSQDEGEIGLHHDPRALARFFQNALQGLQITARAGTPRAELEGVIRVTLSVMG